MSATVANVLDIVLVIVLSFMTAVDEVDALALENVAGEAALVPVTVVVATAPDLVHAHPSAGGRRAPDHVMTVAIAPSLVTAPHLVTSPPPHRKTGKNSQRADHVQGLDPGRTLADSLVLDLRAQVDPRADPAALDQRASLKAGPEVAKCSLQLKSL